MVHLFDKSMHSAGSDEYLERLAEQFRGSKFVRGMGELSLLYMAMRAGGEEGSRSSSLLDKEWNIKSKLPMLLTLQKGKVVAWIPVPHLFKWNVIGELWVDDLKVRVILGHSHALLSGVRHRPPPPVETVWSVGKTGPGGV